MLSTSGDSTRGAARADAETQLRLEAVRRQECLHAPLSPSAEELGHVGKYRHEVAGTKREQHLFFPPRGKAVNASRLDAILKELSARFPELGNISMLQCGETDQRGKLPKTMCVHVEVPICEAWLPKAERLLDALAPQGFALLVEIVGRVGPRCIGDTCLPPGYHDRPPAREDQTWSGWFTLPYRPADARTPVMPELGSGMCSADGDCEITGCGNHCEGWAETPHGANCPAYSELADAHCGCQANACSWFTQAPTIDVKAEVTVEGWNLGAREDSRSLGERSGEKSDAKADEKSGETVFRQLLEAPWFRRHLERVKSEQAVTLPAEFAFQLTLDRRFQVASANVTVDAQQGPRWLEEILLHLPVPVPDVPAKEKHPKPVSVKGRVFTAAK
jgi:hypothetical protein